MPVSMTATTTFAAARREIPGLRRVDVDVLREDRRVQSPQVARDEVRIVRRGLQRHDVIRLDVEHVRGSSVLRDRLRRRRPRGSLTRWRSRTVANSARARRRRPREAPRHERSCSRREIGPGPRPARGRRARRWPTAGQSSASRTMANDRESLGIIGALLLARIEPGVWPRDDAALPAPRWLRGGATVPPCVDGPCRVPGATEAGVGDLPGRLPSSWSSCAPPRAV